MGIKFQESSKKKTLIIIILFVQTWVSGLNPNEGNNPWFSLT